MKKIVVIRLKQLTFVTPEERNKPQPYQQGILMNSHSRPVNSHTSQSREETLTEIGCNAEIAQEETGVSLTSHDYANHKPGIKASARSHACQNYQY